VYGNVVQSFSIAWVAVFYVVAMVALAFHLHHGVWSVFQTLGASHPNLSGARRGLALLLAIAWTVMPLRPMKLIVPLRQSGHCAVSAGMVGVALVLPGSTGSGIGSGAPEPATGAMVGSGMSPGSVSGPGTEGVMPLGVMPLGVMPLGVVPAGVMPVGVMPVGVMPVGVIPAEPGAGVSPDACAPVGPAGTSKVIPLGLPPAHPHASASAAARTFVRVINASRPALQTRVPINPAPLEIAARTEHCIASRAQNGQWAVRTRRRRLGRVENCACAVFSGVTLACK
jgi:hypothetical protein